MRDKQSALNAMNRPRPPGEAPCSILLVDSDPVADILISEEGLPVWPAGSREDLAALERIAATFGAVVVTARGRAAEGTAFEHVEEVASFGQGTERLARLYAHLTARSHRRATTLNGIWRDGPPSVVVTTPELLTDALLERVCAGATGASVTGIICLRDIGGRGRRQVLVRTAAAALCGPLETREVLCFPRGKSREICAGERWILGAKTPRDTILGALQSRAGVLAISAHSDGIDVDLGPELLLCPYGGRDNFSVEQVRPPRCCMERHCHRLDTPVSAAWDTGKLVTTDAFSARVLVLYVCQGLLHRDGVVHPDWGIVPRLLENPGIGAIVTSWSFIVTSSRAVAALTSLASSGLPLGHALSAYNRSRSALELSHGLCLFGDPRVRMPLRQAIAPPSPVFSGSRPKPRHPAPGAARSAQRGDYALLKACLSLGPDNRPADQSALARRASEKIRLYEDALGRGLLLEEGECAPADEMRWAFIDYVIGGGAQTLGIAECVRFKRSIRTYKRSGTCFACGRRRRSAVVTLRIHGARPRRMDTCPRCGITADAPADIRVELSVSGPRVLLSGPLPLSRWAAGFYVKSWYEPDSFGSRWPADEEGRPVNELRLRRSLPTGQLRVYFYLVTGESLAIASCPARSEPSTIEPSTGFV